MSKQGGLLDELAKKSAVYRTDKYEVHKEFGLLRAEFKTEFKDVAFRLFGLIPLIVTPRFNVNVYEKGANLINARTGRMHAIPYSQIKKFKIHRDHVSIALTTGKKFYLENDTVANLSEVGNALDCMIKEFWRTK